MNTVYIQFQAPKSQITTEIENSLKRCYGNLVTNILTVIFPVANSDFGNKINDVKYWLIECDTKSGVPQREIGLNFQGEVLVKMPYKANYGFWTDNNLLLDDFQEHFKAAELTKEEFEQKWILLD